MEPYRHRTKPSRKTMKNIFSGEHSMTLTRRLFVSLTKVSDYLGTEPSIS